MSAELPPKPHRGWTFHEVPEGKRWSTSRRTITETDLVVYATQFGFVEGLFLDATGSERAGYSGRLVPGSLVMSIAEGLIISGGAIAGTGIAYLGAEVQVKGPTFVNDTVQVIAEVTEARMTSKNDRGIVTTRNEVFNQKGEVVMVYTPTRMILTDHSAE
ncbi:MAG TPA: acyl dehydratase [Acidimicrobiaceae bacterium]|jgi:acyl dehydratase|nr:acyl dehydratase [Acidimicrobiaceae bacterium]MCH2632329.1 MaoC family dehydratase N-terminal domain-containing protein [Acidimicrobiales bacterium]HAY64860.1 acyl dehydratase [Acidimicrobiaceae bacterium]|tara:strand:- start:1047 stop:1526 length:480 start_codon:yes stop_codon:yes gene_type:complete